MFNQLVIWLFYCIIASSLIFGLINLLRSNLYDMRQTKLRRQRKLHPHSRHLRARPLLSVIVFADNNLFSLGECLTSLSKSSYKKLEIIIVDNASVDGTAKLAREFIKQHPKMSVRLVAKRRASTRGQAITQAAHYATGELMAVVDASCILNNTALRNCVLQLAQTKAEIILFNIQASHGYSLLGLADSLKSTLLGRVKKASGYIVPGLDSHNYAALYHRAAFETLVTSNISGLNDINALRRKKLKLAYESLGIATLIHAPVHPLASPASSHLVATAINSLRGALSILEPFVIAIMAFVAVRFNNSGYIVGAWLCFTSFLLLAVWSDETYKLTDKFKLSLLSLIAYLLYLSKNLLDYAVHARRFVQAHG